MKQRRQLLVGKLHEITAKTEDLDIEFCVCNRFRDDMDTDNVRTGKANIGC